MSAENNGGVAVSVICITYNHEKYLRTALESVVSQITDFSYEVIIGDDVSVDGTVTHVYAADGAKSSFKYSDMATGGDGNKYFKIDQLPAGTYCGQPVTAGLHAD